MTATTVAKNSSGKTSMESILVDSFKRENVSVQVPEGTQMLESLVNIVIHAKRPRLMIERTEGVYRGIKYSIRTPDVNFAEFEEKLEKIKKEKCDELSKSVIATYQVNKKNKSILSEDARKKINMIRSITARDSDTLGFFSIFFGWYHMNSLSEEKEAIVVKLMRELGDKLLSEVGPERGVMITKAELPNSRVG